MKRAVPCDVRFVSNRTSQGTAPVTLGKQALYDANTVLICAAATASIFFLKKIPEPLVIICAGAAGYFLR